MTKANITEAMQLAASKFTHKAGAKTKEITITISPEVAARLERAGGDAAVERVLTAGLDAWQVS